MVFPIVYFNLVFSICLVFSRDDDKLKEIILNKHKIQDLFIINNKYQLPVYSKKDLEIKGNENLKKEFELIKAVQNEGN